MSSTGMSVASDAASRMACKLMVKSCYAAKVLHTHGQLPVGMEQDYQ